MGFKSHTTSVLSINCKSSEMPIPPWIIRELDPKWSNGEINDGTISRAAKIALIYQSGDLEHNSLANYLTFSAKQKPPLPLTLDEYFLIQRGDRFHVVFVRASTFLSLGYKSRF